LDRLHEFNRQQALPTAQTTGQSSQFYIVEAYQKLSALPGYRLENRHIVHQGTDNRTEQIIRGEYDARGNAHILIQSPAGPRREVYRVDNQLYVFEPQYEGWVNTTIAPPTDQSLPAALNPLANLSQLLTQAGALPSEPKAEILLNRPVTRYTLAQAVNYQPASPSIDLRGAVWVDDQTGAVIKSEIFLYENKDSLPSQEFVLEISQIGQIAPIAAPMPVIDPTTLAAATVETQLVFPASLDYRGEQISFEIVPLQVRQIPASSPRSAEIKLLLRQLPPGLFQPPGVEPFLAQLRPKLTLSIPERNLVVTSSGFRLENNDAKNHTLMALYSFNADLEDFSHIELILSGQGNPLFMPVPVE